MLNLSYILKSEGGTDEQKWRKIHRKFFFQRPDWLRVDMFPGDTTKLFHQLVVLPDSMGGFSANS